MQPVTLRPGIITSTHANTVSVGAELLFVRLLLMAKDGRVTADEHKLKAELYPIRPAVKPAHIREWINELVGPLCRRATINGEPYLEILRWNRPEQDATDLEALTKELLRIARAFAPNHTLVSEWKLMQAVIERIEMERTTPAKALEAMPRNLLAYYRSKADYIMRLDRWVLQMDCFAPPPPGRLEMPMMNTTDEELQEVVRIGQYADEQDFVNAWGGAVGDKRAREVWREVHRGTD